MIYRQIRGEKIDEKHERKYKTIDNSRTGLCPDKEKKKALSSAFRYPRKDIYFKNDVIDKHFKKDGVKNCCQ